MDISTTVGVTKVFWRAESYLGITGEQARAIQANHGYYHDRFGFYNFQGYSLGELWINTWTCDKN